MSYSVRKYVAAQIAKHVGEKHDLKNLRIYKPKKDSSSTFSLLLPGANDISESLEENIPVGKSESFIENITDCDDKSGRGVLFRLDRNFFIKNTIEDALKNKHEAPAVSKRLIFEFSSPNIAKPFHMGHLRSTIIGNFLSNINTFSLYDVLKINYLGDWGTQFGLLKVGMELNDVSLDKIRENPIQVLFEAYVHANKLAEKDPLISERAKEAFKHLEDESSEDIERWQMYKDLSMEALIKMYSRLNVAFDEYAWESMYSFREISCLIDNMEQSGIIKVDEDGKKVVFVNDRKVTIAKSDGTTLYLSRDIAAAIERFDKYKFDEMYYVVDNAQTDHFVALFNVLEQMNQPFAKSCKHIKFGRIRGMSTRKGNVVFLKDILDEAKDRMHQRRIEKTSTRGNVNDEEISDILGTTAVIINDLKQKRQRDYEFSWDNALHSEGDSGIKLQYVHCRLSSIEKNCGIKLPKECHPEVLTEPEAIDLIRLLAEFEHVITKSRTEMEACILVVYLFNLGNAVNRAIKVLKVKDQPADIAGQRLLLFHSARLVIKRSLEVLGVKPLNEM